MPFVSQSQRKLFYAKEERGELPKGTAKRWEEHTHNKNLPEHVKTKKKEASPMIISFLDELEKIGKEKKAAGVVPGLNFGGAKSAVMRAIKHPVGAATLAGAGGIAVGRLSKSKD